jgi:hypothetical protein
MLYKQMAKPPYSPECVEGVFSEVHMQKAAYIDWGTAHYAA